MECYQTISYAAKLSLALDVSCDQTISYAAKHSLANDWFLKDASSEMQYSFEFSKLPDNRESLNVPKHIIKWRFSKKNHDFGYPEGPRMDRPRKSMKFWVLTDVQICGESN